jgi:hypothetical protein
MILNKMSPVLRNIAVYGTAIASAVGVIGAAAYLNSTGEGESLKYQSMRLVAAAVSALPVALVSGGLVSKLIEPNEDNQQQ